MKLYCFILRGQEVTPRGNKRAGVSPGDLHERDGHGGGVDGQVAVQVDDDADVEHVDSD